jgi:NAD(P)-dependent dehydrogenase (short-subunit alcohol dehydrogenase family)
MVVCWTAVAGYGAGTEGVARGLAVDLAPIRVNTVSPGAFSYGSLSRA